MGDGRTALIAGAGIGGLAAAIALRCAGWRVEVFERDPEPRALGFGIVAPPNAMAALRELGVADAVTRAGHVVRKGELRGTGGRVLRRLDAAAVTAALGEDAVCILRPALHAVLLEALGPGTVRCGAAIEGFEQRDGRVVIRFVDGRAEGDLLVGADGAGSTVRRILHPVEPSARSSGLLGVRGVVRGELAEIDGFQCMGRGVELGVVRAGGGSIYWYMSVPADTAGAARESPREFVRSVAARFGPAVAITDATRGEDIRLDDLLVRDPLERWGNGVVTLLGDAAHPMLPHAGQGAAQALEDAVCLARSLSGGPVEAGLRRYESVRIPRSADVAALAKRNARITSMRGWLACTLRDLAARLVPEGVITRQSIDIGRPRF